MGAAHVAMCLRWAEHSVEHFASSTSRRLLTHLLAAADSSGAS